MWRTAATHSRSCSTGFGKSTPKWLRVTQRVLDPSPRTNRPFEIRSRSSAANAVSKGLRTPAIATLQASWTRSVTAAAAASGIQGGPQL